MLAIIFINLIVSKDIKHIVGERENYIFECNVHYTN